MVCKLALCHWYRRFLEDKIHDKEVMVEKLSLKNTTFKAAIAKLEAQVAHKEEMGEVSTICRTGFYA